MAGGVRGEAREGGGERGNRSALCRDAGDEDRLRAACKELNKNYFLL